MKPHWLMWKPMLTTLLILRMDFHNDAKSELWIGMGGTNGILLAFLQWMLIDLCASQCILIFHNDAKSELDIENYLLSGIITMVWVVPMVPFWLFFYELFWCQKGSYVSNSDHTTCVICLCVVLAGSYGAWSTWQIGQKTNDAVEANLTAMIYSYAAFPVCIHRYSYYGTRLSLRVRTDAL
jgi:hypothetical protein